MYLPKHFEETDVRVLQALIRAHPLATWVTQFEGGLVANHVPLQLDAERGTHGTLVGHVARANPVWRTLGAQQESLLVFQGADAYVSPSWYPSKQAHGKVVPTWNYAIVHVHGVARPIEDREWLLRHVTALSATHEQGQAHPWQVSDAPADFIDSLTRMIVGVEIPIARMVGKWKVSQNRPEADRRGVVAGLMAREDEGSHAMAALVGRFVGGAGEAG